MEKETSREHDVKKSVNPFASTSVNDGMAEAQVCDVHMASVYAGPDPSYAFCICAHGIYVYSPVRQCVFFSSRMINSQDILNAFHSHQIPIITILHTGT